MVGMLLARGMLVGFVAALLSFGFLKLVGEPAVDRAIAFEVQIDQANAMAKEDQPLAKAAPMPANDDEPELVSRRVQAGLGLFAGVAVYSTAFGGLFALVFALAHGRMGDFGPRTTSALLAISGLIAVHIVPNLKYPASPPSVGAPETIGVRTGLYFSMIAFSLAAMIAAWMLRNRLVGRHGGWDAALIAGAAYVAAVVAAALVLPSVNEVPEGFPAVVLWQFRLASLGAQVIMWTTIGLAFGAWMERARTTGGGANSKRHRPHGVMPGDAVSR